MTRRYCNGTCQIVPSIRDFAPVTMNVIFVGFLFPNANFDSLIYYRCEDNLYRGGHEYVVWEQVGEFLELDTCKQDPHLFQLSDLSRRPAAMSDLCMGLAAISFSKMLAGIMLSFVGLVITFSKGLIVENGEC